MPSGAAAARDAGNVIASERINTTARHRTTSMRMRPSLRAPTVKPQTEVHEIGWDMVARGARLRQRMTSDRHLEIVYSFGKLAVGCKFGAQGHSSVWWATIVE